jgi:hypothetical protein
VLNKTYHKYITPILQYGVKLILTSDRNLNKLVAAHNKTLRIVTGAVKTTPVTVDYKRHSFYNFSLL